MFFLSKLCSLCLGINKNLKLVLSEKELKYCLPEIIVDSPSQIPKYVCSNCLDKLECFYKFKQICLRNNTYLKSYFKTLTSSDTDESYKHLSVTLTDIKYQKKLQTVSSDQTLPTVGSDELPTGENLDNETFIKETVLSNEIHSGALLDTGASHALFEEEYDIVVKDEFLPLEDNADREYYQECVKSLKCEPISSDADVSVSRIEDIVHENSENSNSSSDENEPSTSDEMETEEIEKEQVKQAEKFKCAICGSEYFHKNTLKKHLKAHADNNSTSTDSSKRRFKCNDCLKAFTSLSVLERHTRTHTGERPFKCPTCQQTFTEAGNLKRHKLIHTGERSHECDICNKTFNQKCHLILHKRTHYNIRPFQCTHCNYTCTQAGHLSRHMRVHTGEKPHQCHMCLFKCAHANHLKRHIRTHTGEKPYSCQHCQKSFTTSGELKVHKRRLHRNEDA